MTANGAALPSLVAIGAVDDPHILEVMARTELDAVHVSLQDMIRQGWAITPSRTGRPSLSVGDTPLSCGHSTVIWLRKLSAHSLIEGFSGWEQAWAAEEWRAACDALYTCFEAGRWFDHPRVVSQSEDKVRQLAAAVHVGFQVPQWSVGNVPAFVPEGVDLVLKRLGTRRVPVPVGDHPVAAPFDRAMCDLDEFRLGVNFVQRRVLGSLEIRLVLGGSSVSAFSHDRGNVLDVHDSPNFDAWERHEVDRSITQNALDLQAALGLTHCTIDLVVDDFGTIWFLELNPRGNYLWLGDAADVDLTGQMLCFLSEVHSLA